MIQWPQSFPFIELMDAVPCSLEFGPFEFEKLVDVHLVVPTERSTH